MTYGPLPRRLPDRPPTAAIELPGLWSVLQGAVSDLHRYDSHSGAGEAVTEYLFGRGGEMTKLAEIASNRDGSALRVWHERHGQPNDSRWLDRVTRAAGQPTIDTNRRVSFTSKRRSIRLAVRQVTKSLEIMDEEGAGPDSPADQVMAVEILRTAVRRAMESGTSALSPLNTALRLEIGRLEKQLDGTPASTLVLPGAALDSWPWPHVRAVDSRPIGADEVRPDRSERVFDALLRDLAGQWAPTDAVQILLDLGEFWLADLTVDELIALGTIEGPEGEALCRATAVTRARAVADLKAHVQELRFQCDRSGLVDDRFGASVDELWGDSVATSQAYWNEVEKDVMSAARKRKLELTSLLEKGSAAMDPGWVEHIEALLASGELSTAALALIVR